MMNHVGGYFRNLGRRGALLLTLGLVWVLTGLATFGTPAIPDADWAWFEDLPTWPRALLWISTGLVAIVFAGYPKSHSDAPGFAALYIVPFLKLLSFLTGWFVSLLPDQEGFSRGFLSGMIYGVVLIILVICAGWKEPVGDDGRR